MGHKRAPDISRTFDEATKNLNLNKSVHLGHDNVDANIKLKNIEIKRRKEHNKIETNKDNQTYQLIDTGGCILHVCNDGLKHGQKDACLGVMEFLEGSYYSFRKSSSRYEDLDSLADSEVLHPLPYVVPDFWKI